jgi:hypothetical protein
MPIALLIPAAANTESCCLPFITLIFNLLLVSSYLLAFLTFLSPFLYLSCFVLVGGAPLAGGGSADCFI